MPSVGHVLSAHVHDWPSVISVGNDCQRMYLPGPGFFSTSPDRISSDVWTAMKACSRITTVIRVFATVVV